MNSGENSSGGRRKKRVAAIRFGTSGWRAIIADDFTFENVRIVSQAISDYLNREPFSRRIIVGYDSRFLGREFAVEASKVFAANGIKVLLSKSEVPTPAISHFIIENRLDGGINITASHNPPIYSGLKFSPSWGGPALPEDTEEIERRINQLVEGKRYRIMSEEEAYDSGLIEEVDPKDSYLNDICSKIDLDLIKKADICMIIDPRFGAGRGYIEEIFSEKGITFRSIHSWRDPCFGGSNPDTDEGSLGELCRIMSKEKDIFLGLSLDGDADRFGIVDRGGHFIQPNYIIALLLDYLLSKGIKAEGVARSVATTHLIDAIAERHNLKVYETPVGFKYIGKLIAEDRIILGGEESGGLSIRGHIPEKDGIIACLLVAEMVAARGETITEMLQSLYRNVGTFRTKREDINISMESMVKMKEIATSPPSSIAGKRIERIVNLDGIKFILEDNSWVLIRASGTEPVVRIYAEAHSERLLNSLLESVKSIFL